jgi:hypothetical protein
MLSSLTPACARRIVGRLGGGAADSVAAAARAISRSSSAAAGGEGEGNAPSTVFTGTAEVATDKREANVATDANRCVAAAGACAAVVACMCVPGTMEALPLGLLPMH